MNLSWYVLRSKPNKELVLAHEACARGLDVFCPQIKIHPVNPRAHRVRPYFPGYLFIRLNLSEVSLSMMSWMPYSQGLVCCGSEPSPVPDALIQVISRKVDEINAVDGEFFVGLEKGERISIIGGVFADYEAIFDARVSGTERVRVLLEFLDKRQIPLELSIAQLQRGQLI